MTLPKRNSRPIEVDSKRFRYVISQSGTSDAGQFSLNLTVQIESGRGCILQAKGLLTRDFWLDFPKCESEDNYLIVKPGQVAAIIKRARDGGWDPDVAGMPFILAITSAVLTQI
jgi:hypothetical protein